MSDLVLANRQLLASRSEQFATAWGNKTDGERFILAATSEIAGDPKLLECSDASKLSCLMQLCQWKLMLGKSLGHAYLVPFRNKDTKLKECTIMVGYKGYVRLAYQSGLPTFIQTRVVREGDTFEYDLGTSATVSHKLGAKRGERTHVWLLIQFKDSQFVDVMNAEEIKPIKDFALKMKGEGFSPWQGAFEDEMWCKSIIRRDAKRLPLGELFEQVAAYESEVETMQVAQTEPDLPYPRKALMQNASTLMDTEGVIVSVTEREMHDKKDRNKTYPLFTVTMDNGTEYSTFDKGFGEKARSLQESAETCCIEFQEEKNGRRILNLEAV